MARFLIISLICVIIVAGISYFSLDNWLEKQLEKSIREGYPGTEDVNVEITIDWLAGGLKGTINELNITVANWNLAKWTLNSFEGQFRNVKINWFSLIKNQKLVVEDIEEGGISAVIDNNNLAKGVQNYYPGFTVKTANGGLRVGLKVNIMGKELEAFAFGSLVPGQGAAVNFKPQSLDIAGYRITGFVQEKILQNIKIRLALEKIPFHFQVTTVRILQDKILIDGSIDN